MLLLDRPAATTDDVRVEADLVDLGRAGRHGRVVVAGPLDAASAGVLADGLARLLAADVRDVVVDATDVDFLDSSGLRALVRARNELAARGGSLVVDGMSPAAERVLELTGLLEGARAA